MSKKDLKQFIRDVERAGGRYEEGKKHGVIYTPDGRKYFCSKTPSDHRAIRNIRSDLKRLFGFEV